MDTLVVKVSEHEKVGMLVEMLKSMDFIDSVDWMADLRVVDELFDKANEAALSTDLREMTMDEINNEIKAYRREKRVGSN